MVITTTLHGKLPSYSYIATQTQACSSDPASILILIKTERERELKEKTQRRPEITHAKPKPSKKSVLPVMPKTTP